MNRFVFSKDERGRWRGQVNGTDLGRLSDSDVSQYLTALLYRTDPDVITICTSSVEVR